MRLTKWAARMYPRWWRERYGQEFATLLEDARPGFGGAVDVAKGAMAMQMKTWPAKRVVAVGALVGLLGGVIVGLRRPRYESAVILTSTAPLEAESVNTIAGETFSRAKLTQLVRTMNLYQEERNRLPLEEIMNQMRRDISLVPAVAKADGSHALEIRFRYPEESVARKAAGALAGALIDSGRPSGMVFQVLHEPQPPKRLFPNPTSLAGIGFLGGIVVTGLFALGLWIGRRQVSAKQE